MANRYRYIHFYLIEYSYISSSHKPMSRQISPTVQKLHTQFRFYGKNAREWMRKCVLMLPELERERVWEKKGYGSLSEYAGRLSGMSHKTVIDGLRILQMVADMPDIMRVIERRGINCVRPIVTLLTKDNQQFWAEKIEVMSQHALEMYRREWQREYQSSSTQHRSSLSTIPDLFGERALSEIINSPQQDAIEIADHSQQNKQIFTRKVAHDPANPSPEKIFAISLKPEIIEQLEKLNGKDGDWNTLMEELLTLRAQKLEQEKPEEKQTESRHIPAAIERFVIERSRGICEVGACKQRYAILHHIQRFASEKLHDPDKIVALCKSHERLVHLGLIEDEFIAPKQWKILEQPDTTNPKYHIDQLVQKYRRPG